MLVGQSVWGCKEYALYTDADAICGFICISVLCMDALAHVPLSICFPEKERGKKKNISMCVCVHMCVYRMFIHARGMCFDNRLQEIVLCACVNQAWWQSWKVWQRSPLSRPWVDKSLGPSRFSPATAHPAQPEECVPRIWLYKYPCYCAINFSDMSS